MAESVEGVNHRAVFSDLTTLIYIYAKNTYLAFLEVQIFLNQTINTLIFET